MLNEKWAHFEFLRLGPNPSSHPSRAGYFLVTSETAEQAGNKTKAENSKPISPKVGVRVSGGKPALPSRMNKEQLLSPTLGLSKPCSNRVE